ncbi:MAG: AMP-dependent synthetase/ligase, partial [Christensenellales bacterium]
TSMKNYPLNQTQAIGDLKELTDRSASLYAHKNAFYKMTGRSCYVAVTYGEFGEELAAMANSLLNFGWNGQRIALLGENSYEWILSYFAIVNSNATVVPLDKELPKEELAEQMRRAKVTAIIYSATYEEEAAFAATALGIENTVSWGQVQAGAKLSLDSLLQRGRELLAAGQDRYSSIEIDRERACSILFTSGTTGLSKGVMLCHRNLAANTVSACELVLFTPDDTLLSILPIQHAYEDMCGIFGPIYYGSAIAFCSGVKQLAACLQLFKPTVMVLVPLYIETFHKRIWEAAEKQGKGGKLRFAIGLCNLLGKIGIDLRDKVLGEVRGFFGGRLRIVICGGAYLNPKYVKAFRGLGVKILQGYGITECSPIISANRNESYKDASVGWLAPGCEVRFDADGQILVRGDNVMLGYLDDEEGTAQAFDGDWFMTGDLGYQDEDGFLYVTGRCKNLIVLKNGKNIMPDEIEQRLTESPLIAEALVMEAPGDDNGSESLMALIYPDPDKVDGMDEQSLYNAVEQEVDKINQTLVYYKKVHQFQLRHQPFPKTTTRKIKRYQVKIGEE